MKEVSASEGAFEILTTHHDLDSSHLTLPVVQKRVPIRIVTGQRSIASARLRDERSEVNEESNSTCCIQAFRLLQFDRVQ
jgi:hypothetical protein